MTSFKMQFGTIVTALSVGITEMGYLGMLHACMYVCFYVCVWERETQREMLVQGRLLVMLFRDKASIITLLEKQSERDK